VEQGYSKTNKGETFKFPTEQRQVKFYRPDGTEELRTVTQARPSGNFKEGQSNRGLAPDGSNKLTKGLKGLKEVTGIAGDALDMASLLKAFAEGDLKGVLGNSPFLGNVTQDMIEETDQLLNDFLLAEFAEVLFTGTIEEIGNFLNSNQELGLELVHLPQGIIDTINGGKEMSLFDLLDSDIEFDFPTENSIPTLIDRQSEFIKIRATIHQ